MEKWTWHPGFYLVFIPFLLFAVWFLACVLWGLCDRKPKKDE